MIKAKALCLQNRDFKTPHDIVCWISTCQIDGNAVTKYIYLGISET